MDWYLKVLKNYVGFRGRARRKEYWMFILVNIIFTFVLGLLDTWIDEVEDQLKENTVYQGMLEKISKYEEQVQTMGLSKEKRKTIDKYVTEVSERWILYAESLYQAGMQKILELLNL